ncbi:hypothetical protein BDU57DRAFT_578177 [Ampelomyces quisqualis]|uniref:Uncharacterized protein n=1 Tax=Ampelomyces quisqualis TaxID=50730 RepID=A0A6A5QFR7_AMPQU|nr:hypothetical protein BDU57DRAFT_578177 [Ampelomyces quisqualis]
MYTYHHPPLSITQGILKFIDCWLEYLSQYNGTPTSFRPVFTIPPSADVGADAIPNIRDPWAVHAQDVCPGYKASGLRRTDRGLSATLSLARSACNVHGTDTETLTSKVEYQSDSRLAVNVRPANIDVSNSSQWIVPEDLIRRLQRENWSRELDPKFDWSNEPSMWFSVTRKSSGDVIFTTKGRHLVYENRFDELVNSLLEDYNLSGLGERIHGLKLKSNFTATSTLQTSETPLAETCMAATLSTPRRDCSKPVANPITPREH